jgi:hypothetical protein
VQSFVSPSASRLVRTTELPLAKGERVTFLCLCKER